MLHLHLDPLLFQKRVSFLDLLLNHLKFVQPVQRLMLTEFQELSIAESDVRKLNLLLFDSADTLGLSWRFEAELPALSLEDFHRPEGHTRIDGEL